MPNFFIQKYKYTLLFISILTLMFSSCDMDKYLSANLGLRALTDSTSYYGSVTRAYDGEPVKYARIKLSRYQAYTDSNGRYELPLLYNKDYDRNLIEYLSVFADNYENYSQPVNVFPVPTPLNIEMVWLPPIIHQNAMIIDLIDSTNADLGGPKFCQVIIKDFQDITSVTEVTLRMTYEKNFVYWPMDLIEIEDDNTGHYQSQIIYGGHDIGHHVLYYTILVADADGYKTERTFVSYLLLTEEPLF